MINLPLLQRTMDHITAHQEAWNQGSWRQFQENDNACGTAMCFAGWAAQLDEGIWLTDVLSPEGWYLREEYSTYLLATPAEVAMAKNNEDSVQHELFWVNPTADMLTLNDVQTGTSWMPIISAKTRARLRLGLTMDTCNILFNGDNTLDDLQEMTCDLLRGNNVEYGDKY